MLNSEQRQVFATLAETLIPASDAIAVPQIPIK